MQQHQPAGQKFPNSAAAPRPRTNPWRDSVIAFARNILRFTLWICLVIDVLMLAIFSIAFTFQFLRHLWSWCQRVLFDEPW